MLLVAMIVIVILGTIGLAIEMGVMRLTRNRMQSAADSTALEVLRERDYLPAEGAAFSPLARDHSRRDRNRHIASWVFADEILTDYGTQSEGPGAYVKMSSVYGTANNPMNRGLVIEEFGQGIPVLQTNYSGEPGPTSAIHNEAGGDIVAGHFTGHDEDSEVGFFGNPIHRERSEDYERVDFELPAVVEDAPYADSVVVRLRRTKPYGHESSSPWANDDIPDVRSTGYTMPLMFGLGTTFLGKDPNAGFSVRHHGIPLRATSIAQARPAVRIGVPIAEAGPEWTVGAGRLAIWDRLWVEPSSFATVTSSGEQAARIIVRGAANNYRLQAMDGDNPDLGFLVPEKSWQVGDEVELGALQPNGEPDTNEFREYWETDECYVPLFARGLTPTGPEYFVCGFVRVRIEFLEPPPDSQEPDANHLLIVRLGNVLSPGQPWMAPRNASATFDGTQPATVFPNSLNVSWETLIERLHSIAPWDDELPDIWLESRVYAPAHVR